jgi:hypothetical protein
MKALKKILIGFVAIFGTHRVVLYLFKVDYLITAVRKIYFNGMLPLSLMTKEFRKPAIPKSRTPQPWPLATDCNKVKPTKHLRNGTRTWVLWHSWSSKMTAFGAKVTTTATTKILNPIRFLWPRAWFRQRSAKPFHRQNQKPRSVGV